LDLPTNRPLFVGEVKLMPDQLGKGDGSDGPVAPGMHGTAPTALGQRWHDMIMAGLHSHGMTRVDFTMGDLKMKLGGKEKPINFDTANDIIKAILETQLDSDTANVTLGLKTFLSRFFHASLASTKVYVHSPNKDYAPASGAAKDVNKGEHTTDQFTKKVAAGFALADGAGKITDHTPGQALRMRLSQQIAEKSTKKKKGKKGADGKDATPKEVKKPKTAKDLTGKEELTMHEFMALCMVTSFRPGSASPRLVGASCGRSVAFLRTSAKNMSTPRST